MNKDFNYSYWELKSYLKPCDLMVVGAGIVGLSTAISYKLKNKKADVLVVDRGLLPEGASTKNAGFACFGSAGELLEDLKSSSNHKVVWETVQMRWDGLELLKKRMGEKAIDYKKYGGYELFSNPKEFEEVLDQLPSLNKEVEHVLGIKNCYRKVNTPLQGMKGFSGALHNAFEGQLDSGMLMQNMEQFARALGIRIIYNIQVVEILDQLSQVKISTTSGIFETTKCVVATNGFARQLLKLPDVQPARAQVLITTPIKNLKIKGSFHFDKGYYYFRNINQRLLLGGGRNLDFKNEATDQFGNNRKIQKQLETLLKNQILPNTPYTIEYRWSGIMGIGKEKKPIIKALSPNVIAAVRMGGMGVAIGSQVGELTVKLLN